MAPRIVIALAGIAVVAITLARHELWRDELQAWQIARDNHGFATMLHNTRYEGHPFLWFALLYPIAHAHAGPGALQILQFLIAAATITVAVWKAPFTALQKLLFVFGYFVVYEYGVLARNYGLGALLVVVVCAVAGRRGRRPWPAIGILLALLALTSAFGSLVAIAVLAGLLADERQRHREAPETAAGGATLAAGCVFVIVGLAVAYLQAARTPSDTSNYNHWRLHFDPGLAASSLSAVWRALVPIPALKRADWNTNILHARASIVGVLGLVLFLAVAWVLRERLGALVTWIVGVVLVVGFLYARIGTATASRHVGHIFLCLAAAMWLAPTMQARVGTGTARARGVTRQREQTRRVRAFTVLLVVQVVAGVFAVGLDLAYPFSNGKQMAHFIDAHYPGVAVIGLPDTAASTVAGFLDRPIYYVNGARFGTYVVWNRSRDTLQPLEDLVQPNPPSPSARHVLVLLNAPLGDPNLHLRLVAHYDDGIVRDEHYWLYLADARGTL